MFVLRVFFHSMMIGRDVLFLLLVGQNGFCIQLLVQSRPYYFCEELGISRKIYVGPWRERPFLSTQLSMLLTRNVAQSFVTP